MNLLMLIFFVPLIGMHFTMITWYLTVEYTRVIASSTCFSFLFSLFYSLLQRVSNENENQSEDKQRNGQTKEFMCLKNFSIVQWDTGGREGGRCGVCDKWECAAENWEYYVYVYTMFVSFFYCIMCPTGVVLWRSIS